MPDLIKKNSEAVVIFSGHGVMDNNAQNNVSLADGQYGCTIHFCTNAGVSVYDTAAKAIEEEALRTGKVTKTFASSKTFLRTSSIRLHALRYGKGLDLKTPDTLGLTAYDKFEVSYLKVPLLVWESTSKLAGRDVCQVVIKEEGDSLLLTDLVSCFLDIMKATNNHVDFIWSACRSLGKIKLVEAS